MKQALCFPTLTSEKAKKVLNWLIYGEFTLGFYMYDICRVGPIPAKIQVSHVFKWATDYIH